MRNGARFTVLLALVLAAGTPACDSGRPSNEEPAVAPPSAGKSEQEAARTIPLTPEQMVEFGIEIEAAGPGTIETLIELPGEVRPDRDRVAHVRARFPGVVLEVRKHIGDEVAQGGALAIVESSQSLAPYPLQSLIAGTVIAEDVARGDLASPETDAFIVADLSVVWVDLSVYQSDLDHVRAGQPVVISTGLDRPPASGTISYVAPTVDRETRTGVARVVVPNPDRTWRPGLFVTGRVTVGVAEIPVAIPAAAVQQMANETVVFVVTANGLSPRPIEIGRRDRRLVEVVSGLALGDRFVAKGAFSLKSELDKERFAED